MPLTRRRVLAGAASVAAVAAMPAGVAIAAVEEAPGPLSGGRSLLSGSFAPGAGLGVECDFYADLATGDHWHRSRGAWTRIFDYAESEMEIVMSNEKARSFMDEASDPVELMSEVKADRGERIRRDELGLRLAQIGKVIPLREPNESLKIGDESCVSRNNVDRKSLRIDPVAQGIDVVISGHFHVPKVETICGVLYLNPGSAGRRRFKLPITLATIDITPDGLRPVIHDLGNV